MKDKKEISVEEYLQLRKEVGIWQIAIILFGIFVFILGGLLIMQGSRYITLMYLSVIVMFAMAGIGLFPISRVVQSCDSHNPELRKMKLTGVKVPSNYRNKRYLILAIGLIIMLVSFFSQFDMERGLNKPEKVQTPTTIIETPSSSLVDDISDSLEEDKTND